MFWFSPGQSTLIPSGCETGSHATKGSQRMFYVPINLKSESDHEEYLSVPGGVDGQHGSSRGCGATSSQRCPKHSPDGGEDTRLSRVRPAMTSSFGGV